MTMKKRKNLRKFRLVLGSASATDINAPFLESTLMYTILSLEIKINDLNVFYFKFFHLISRCVYFAKY